MLEFSSVHVWVMLSTKNIMGSLRRSHVTSSVIINCVYSRLCLLPYQSADYVVLTFNRHHRGPHSMVEDSSEAKDKKG